MAEDGDQSAAERPAAQWTATSGFDALTYWNHDLAPSSKDLTRRCLDWLQTAAEVRACVAPSLACCQCWVLHSQSSSWVCPQCVALSANPRSCGLGVAVRSLRLCCSALRSSSALADAPAFRAAGMVSRQVHAPVPLQQVEQMLEAMKSRPVQVAADAAAHIDAE